MQHPIHVIAAVLLVAVTFPGAGALAKGTATKQARTPAFCQSDPTAGFKGDGSNYCAPTAVSDGLIYLTTEREYEDLAPATTPAAHAKLIKQLAAKMATDPAKGTGPGAIMKGIWGYVTARGYEIDRLEYAGWRDIGADNAKRYGQGARPKLTWLRAGAKDPETVLLVNVGWYKQTTGGYKRSGGHWLNVVGTGPGKLDFVVRNPALPVGEQRTKSAVQLTALDAGFKVVGSPGTPATMAGYYKVAGAALPMGKATTAVLDCAMLFTLAQ